MLCYVIKGVWCAASGNREGGGCYIVLCRYTYAVFLHRGECIFARVFTIVIYAVYLTGYMYVCMYVCMYIFSYLGISLQ